MKDESCNNREQKSKISQFLAVRKPYSKRKETVKQRPGEVNRKHAESATNLRVKVQQF